MNKEFLPIKQIGFYPIVNNANWLKRLLPLGVQTIQIRMKDVTDEEIENEIIRCIEIAAKYPNTQLFINDKWKLALKYKAFGVHLGQEDISLISNDEFRQIRESGLRFGISTHNAEEVSKGMALNPSYMSIGPIFHTNSKKLPYPVQGIEGFKYWRKQLKIPLVALAGVTLKDGETLIKAGANGIAIMSGVVNSENPEAITQKWLKLFEKYNRETY